MHTAFCRDLHNFRQQLKDPWEFYSWPPSHSLRVSLFLSPTLLFSLLLSDLPPPAPTLVQKEQSFTLSFMLLAVHLHEIKGFHDLEQQGNI